MCQLKDPRLLEEPKEGQCNCSMLVKGKGQGQKMGAGGQEFGFVEISQSFKGNYYVMTLAFKLSGMKSC